VTLRQEATSNPSGPPPEEVIEACRALARRWHGAEGRISICLSPSTPHRCTDRMLTLIAEAAVADGLGVHTHLLETRPQAAAARRLYGRTMVEHIETLGLLRAGFLGAHAIWLTDSDLDRLVDAGAGVSHNPLSNLYLGSGIARVPELLRRGVAVGIGSDGPNCGSSTSLIEVMKLAAIVHRLGEPEGQRWPSAEDAFRMATLGGARALGLERDVGSIDVGKKADIVLLDAESPGLVPLNDPVMQLVFGETGSAVHTVVVNGEIVVEAGRPTKVDIRDVIAEAAERGQRLADRVRAPLTRAAIFEPYLRETYLTLLREFEGRS
jgi:5-methylthioadenosine/S-adenosylhomocysteine deaminase